MAANPFQAGTAPASGYADESWERLHTYIASALFLAIFLFFWVSLEAFPDLSDPSVLLPNTGGNVVNQVIALGLSGTAVLFALNTGLRRYLLVLSPALIVLFGWMVVSAAVSGLPALAGRKLVLAALIVVQGAVLLLAPSSRRHFAALLAAGVGIALVLSYLGILLIPERSIHQITELIEPQLAGDWRGAFAHKNVAGAACALMIFIGLFVRKAFDTRVGWAIVVAAGVFLIFTRSKTPIGLLPVSFAVAAMILHTGSTGLRIAMALGLVVVTNLLTLGTAIVPGVRSFVELFMSDASFTDRTPIWHFGFEQLMTRPLTGFGFQAFWRTADVFNGGSSIETWAVKAPDGHNGYLDVALNAGIPGLMLFLFWFIVQPVRDLARSEANGADATLNVLFVRIWVFAMLTGCLESAYFSGGGPIWITVLMAILGLRLQASARLATPAKGG